MAGKDKNKEPSLADAAIDVITNAIENSDVISSVTGAEHKPNGKSPRSSGKQATMGPSSTDFLFVGNGHLSLNVSAFEDFMSSDDAARSLLTQAVVDGEFDALTLFVDFPHAEPSKNRYAKHLVNGDHHNGRTRWSESSITAYHGPVVRIPNLIKRGFEQAFDQNAAHQEYTMYPGLHVVYGPPESGKTTYVLTEFGGKATAIIRFGEPFEQTDRSGSSSDKIGASHVSVAGYSLAHVIVSALLLSFQGYRVAIDSLREAVFGLGGAAGPGGVSVSVYSLIASMSSFFASYGVPVTAIVNPMIAGDSSDAIRLGLVSSATSLTQISDSRPVYVSARTRTGRLVTAGGAPDQNTPQDTDVMVGPSKPFGTHLPDDVRGVSGARSVGHTDSATSLRPDRDDDEELRGTREAAFLKITLTPNGL